MNPQQALKQFEPMLVPKQQTLDFDKVHLWTQLPTSDQQACRDALATLLSEIASTRRLDEHER